MQRKARIRTLILVCVLATLGCVVLLSYHLVPALVGARAEIGADPHVVEAMIRAARQAVVLSGGLAVAAVLLLGLGGARLLSGGMRRLRRAAIGLSRDGRTMPSFRIVELAAVAKTLERVFGEAGHRRARVERQRDEAVLLLDSVGEGILQLDPDGRVVRVNRAAVELLGLPAEVRGQPITTFVRHVGLRDVLRRVARGEEVGSREVRVEDRRLLVAARRLEYPGGRKGVVAVLMDLTELRRLEGVRRDFVANASHELKTPLTSIRGYAETLLDEGLDPELRRRFLGRLRHNSERLHRIVDDLLDLSRLESGGWRPELEPVDIERAAESAWESFEERAEQKGVEFRVEPGWPRPVPADRVAIQQIFSNLFDNALRHTPADGRITVLATAAVDADAIAVEVRDTGSGIPGDALGRIFERFYRIDPARSRSEGGTGLGLAIVKHLVEHMGGRVGATSELGKGTTIRFVLPARSEVAAGG